MDIKDINIRNLQAEVVRLRNLLAGRDALAKSKEAGKEEWTKEARVGYISLEEHFAEMDNLRKEEDHAKSRLMAERDEEHRLRMEAEAKIRELEDAAVKSEETHKEELAKFADIQEMADTAKANEIDVMSIVRVMQNRIFNHNSDRMRFLNSQLDIDDQAVKEQGFEAILHAISQEADNGYSDGKDNAGSKQRQAKAEEKDEASKVKLPTPKKAEKKNPQPRSRYTFTAEALKSFGVDTSNLPEGAKAILRKGKKDEWSIQLFYYSPAKVYTKIYKIGRFNVPGNDPKNSKKPQTIVENNPLMPSFCRFYFDSKFAYNLSEENLIRMLENMKCHFPQATLNKYIHQIMDYLRVRLEALMLEVIRSCGYVQNDEEAFKKFLQDGRIEMHNNAVESVFRHIAMGRRNWLNSGSHEAAQNIAFMYSLYESCKMNDIDFGEYVEDILTRMMNGDDNYESMIPCNYTSGQKQEKRVA